MKKVKEKKKTIGEHANNLPSTNYKKKKKIFRFRVAAPSRFAVFFSFNGIAEIILIFIQSRLESDFGVPWRKMFVKMHPGFSVVDFHLFCVNAKRAREQSYN